MTGIAWIDWWLTSVAVMWVVAGIILIGWRAARFADRWYDWRERR